MQGNGHFGSLAVSYNQAIRGSRPESEAPLKQARKRAAPHGGGDDRPRQQFGHDRVSADFSEAIIGYSLFDVANLSYYEATGFFANDGEMLILTVQF